jgi:hypothetical protein
MAERYKVVDGSQSGHCCFDATVVDTTKPTGYRDHCEPMCECFERADAERIAAALNAIDGVPRIDADKEKATAERAGFTPGVKGPEHG